MEKFTKKFSVLLASLAMVMGVGLAGNKENVKAADETVYTTGKPSWGTSYAFGNQKLGDVTWYVTTYGNNASIGWNSAGQNKSSSATMGPLSVITETTKYGFYQVDADFASASKIEVSITNADSVSGKYYVFYSVDSGANWTTAVSEALSASTTSIAYDKGSAIGESVRFAIGIGTTKTTKTRITLNGINVYKPGTVAETPDAIIALIDDIGTVAYTDECKAKIDAARAAYDSASDTLRAQVTNYATLTVAEAEYARLEADAKETADLEAAIAVEDMISAIGGVDTITDYSKANEIKAARDAYDKLTDDQKALVNADSLATLEALEAKVAEFAPAVTADSAMFEFSSTNTHLSASALATTPATEKGISVSVDKGSNTSNAPTTNLPIRIYTGFIFKISGDATVYAIKSLDIVGNSASYASVLSNSTWNPTAPVTVTGSDVHVEFSSEVTEVTVQVSAQTRWDSLTVNFEKVAADENTKVESISVTPNPLKLEVGELKTLTAEVLPANAYDKSVTWSSSKTDVVSVNDAGEVTAVAVGDAVITATANDGSGVSGTTNVTVLAGALVSYEPTAQIGDTFTANGVEFTVTSPSTYKNYNGTNGAQFGSNSNPAKTVTFVTKTTAFDRASFRVVVGANFSGTGPGTLKVTLGATVLGEVELTKTSAPYEFEIPASASSAEANDADILTVALTNEAGAVYLKSLDVYSAGMKTVVDNVGDFVTAWHELRTAGGENGICSALVAGSAERTKLEELLATYDGLTAEEKEAIDATIDTEDVTIGTSIAYVKSVLDGTQKTDGEYGVADSTIKMSEIANNSTVTLVALLALVGVIAVSAYYFIEKKKLAK